MLQPGPGSRALSGWTSRCRSDSWDSHAPAGARDCRSKSRRDELERRLGRWRGHRRGACRTVLTAILGFLRPAASGPPGHCQGGEPPGVPGLLHQHTPGDGGLPADVARRADGRLGRGRSEGQAVRMAVPGRDYGRLSKPLGPSKAPASRGSPEPDMPLSRRRFPQAYFVLPAGLPCDNGPQLG